MENLQQKQLLRIRHALSLLEGRKLSDREKTIKEKLKEIESDLLVCTKKPNWVLWFQVANFLRDLLNE